MGRGFAYKQLLLLELVNGIGDIAAGD